ncbi:MAG: hypothetical protein RL172_3152 [Bacteroidota bacterium]|jgi:urease accessory protein
MRATLNIQAASSNALTYLQEVYFTTPFKVMDITENKKAGPLHLMLMNASPGILDGDEYTLHIQVKSQAVLHLHTQAYQRLYTMKQGARQLMDVLVEPEATFIYLPHPSVPHELSVFTCCNNFYLAHNSRLVFGEVLTCGRKLNGEAFRFSKYHSITQVFINNQLAIKENLLLQPSVAPVNTIGQLEGYTHQASMMLLGGSNEYGQLQLQILQLLAAETNIQYGVSSAPVSGLLIRLLGYGAEQLYSLLQNILALAQPEQVKILHHAG